MRAAKCSFMLAETKYLGRVVSAEGIKPDPEAIEKVKQWIAPRNREELQSFLGLRITIENSFHSLHKKQNQ